MLMIKVAVGYLRGSLTRTWPAAGTQAQCCACGGEGARWGASPAGEGTRGDRREEARRRSRQRGGRTLTLTVAGVASSRG
jgi:hypothetical protein